MKNLFVKTISLVLISFMYILGCSKEKPKEFPYNKSDLEKMKLRGKVKTCREYSYKANSSFGKISKGERQYEEGLEDGDFYTFNTNGFINERIEYDIKDDIKEKNTYIYDENEKLIETKRYYSDKKSLYLLIYKYDEKGFLVERTLYNSKGNIDFKEVYENQKENNEITVNRYENDGELYSSSNSRYDNKGNIVEYRDNTYSENGSSNLTFYLYDNQGNLIEENWASTLTDDGRTLNIISNYNYNKYGDKIEYWFDDSTESKTTYEYEYDSHNNWIKRIEFDRRFPKFILERKIEYY